MRTFSDLRKYILPVPSLFAEGSTKISQETGSDGKFYTEGFPIAYSRDPNSSNESLKGKYLLRNDFNRFGEIATRETHFRQSGGIHTFSKKVSSYSGGYPRDSVLDAFDGEYIQKVESTESGNTKSFVNNDGIVVRNIIDCPVRKDDETTETAKRILWKSVGWINGIVHETIRLNLDYTKAYKVSTGSLIKKDSLLIGSFIGFISHQTTEISTLQPLTHITNLSASDPLCSGSIQVKNKGRYGDAYYYMQWFIVTIVNGQMSLKQLPCPYQSLTGGTGNYFLYFFVKGGTTFSFRSDEVSAQNNIEWMAIPYRPTVVESEE